MKVVTLADTHGYHYYIGKTSPALPAGDVIVHAGDLTGRGRLYELIEFANWFGGLDYKNKICIAGNHDEVAENMGNNNVKDLFWERGITYLCDSEYVIDGIKFYGTPYTPEFCGWSFMESEHDLKKRYDNIPEDTDVLITHGPPYGVLDSQVYVLSNHYSAAKDRTGSTSLLKRIQEINTSPKGHIYAHIFGHIHEGRGMNHWYCDGDMYVVNASFLDPSYTPYNIEQEVIEIN